MDSIGILFKLLLIKLIILSISSFYGVLTIIRLIYGRFKFGKDFFETKERTLPPKVLQDPAFNHSYIQLKSVKLHYAEIGDTSKPLMLFVHGFPEFWFTWRSQMKYFAKDYRCVAFDMRGYGDSDKPEGIENYKIEYLIEDVVEIVKRLGAKNCTLVAHDWGGVIAWNVAAFHPSIVKNLIILNAPHPGAFQIKIKTSIVQFLKSWYIFLFQLPYLPEVSSMSQDMVIFDRLFARSNKTRTITPDELEAFKYTFRTKDCWTFPINYYRASLAVRNILNKVVDKLPKITSPTLIIWGEDDLALEKDLPDLSMKFVTGKVGLEKIKGGNHFIQNDKPDEVNSIMEKYLQTSN